MPSFGNLSRPLLGEFERTRAGKIGDRTILIGSPWFDFRIQICKTQTAIKPAGWKPRSLTSLLWYRMFASQLKSERRVRAIPASWTQFDDISLFPGIYLTGPRSP
jgi:hypothetical protein